MLDVQDCRWLASHKHLAKEFRFLAGALSTFLQLGYYYSQAYVLNLVGRERQQFSLPLTVLAYFAQCHFHIRPSQPFRQRL